MKNVSFTKIAVWLVLAVNIMMWCFFVPSFLKDYISYQELSWKMDSTQNRLIKELVDNNNKLVDNQKSIMNQMKSYKKE